VKIFRLLRLNAAEAGANPESDHQSQAQQAGHLELREVPRHLSSKVRHRSQNMLRRQRENYASSQVPARVGQGKFRRRGATKDLSANDSAHRRLPAQVNTVSAAEGHRLDFISR
jgi:hypothetical protein